MVKIGWEVLGMIIYGGLTTILFIIASIFAHKRLHAGLHELNQSNNNNNNNNDYDSDSDSTCMDNIRTESYILNVIQIHKRRQLSRHSMLYWSKNNKTDLCYKIKEYFKEMWRNRSIYSPSIQHAWDVATDISILIKWGHQSFYSKTKIHHLDTTSLFFTSLFIQISYRLVSAWAVYKAGVPFKR